MRPIRHRRHKSARRTAGQSHDEVWHMLRQLERDGLVRQVRTESDIESHVVWDLTKAVRTARAA